MSPAREPPLLTRAAAIFVPPMSTPMTPFNSEPSPALLIVKGLHDVQSSCPACREICSKALHHKRDDEGSQQNHRFQPESHGLPQHRVCTTIEKECHCHAQYKPRHYARNRHHPCLSTHHAAKPAARQTQGAQQPQIATLFKHVHRQRIDNSKRGDHKDQSQQKPQESHHPLDHLIHKYSDIRQSLEQKYLPFHQAVKISPHPAYIVFFHAHHESIRTPNVKPVSYTHLRAHETDSYLV